MNWSKKNIYITISLVIFSSIFVVCFSLFNNSKDQYTSLKTVYRTLYFFHPQPKKINDAFSKRVFFKYFDNLDPMKVIFYKKDIDFFSYYKDKLDDAFINGDITFFKKTINYFYKRIEYLEYIYEKLLKIPFNFDLYETVIFHKKSFSYPKNIREWKDRIRLYLKYLTIIEMDSILNNEDKFFILKRYLLLNNYKKYKINNPIINESLYFLEKQARKKVLENIRKYFKKIKLKKKSDLFSLYINANTSQYDPHTMFLSEIEKKSFDVDISGEIEGIGVQMEDNNGYPTIRKIVLGSPAWKSKKIEIGDKIIKVSINDDEKKDKNIVGMPLEDSINYIRGKKGTKVHLTIQKKDGSQKRVSLIRKLIEKEEIFVKSLVISDKNKNKYGLIILPEFYFNPNNKKARNSSDDIKQELQSFKKQNVSGVILDLRNNSGGSLQSVINIVGFFIGKGPVAQILRNDGRKEILTCVNNNILWKGPLIIIVNESSASASEILASAIKDYNRGIIIGSDKTFGKGTIQALYPLSNKLGMIKITVGKFYRINGKSTQLKGINSDIVIPSNYTNSNLEREKDLYNPLPWDKISPVIYHPWKSFNIQKIIYKSNYRIKNNKNINLLKYYINNINKNFIYLNLQKFILNKKNYNNILKNIFILNIKYNILYPSLIHNNYIFNIKNKFNNNIYTDLCIKESIRIFNDFY